MRTSVVMIVGLLLMSLGACIILKSEPRVSHARKALKLRKEGHLNEAIGEYKLHIQARLLDKLREPDENPYFYEILIGDIQLQQQTPAEAMESYLTAMNHEIEQPLVADRIRRVAKYFAGAGKYREALELLHRYRSLDELVFDSDIDEITKKMIKQEDG